VYVPVGTQNNTHDIYMKIYARLAADFYGKAAYDRSAILPIFEGGVTGPMSGARDGQPNQEHWADLLGKLKGVLVTSFLGRLRRYEQEAERLEEQRAQPEWDFFTFFFARESVALVYEQLQLPSEALAQYVSLSDYCQRWSDAVPAVAPKSLVMFRSTGTGPCVIEFPITEVGGCRGSHKPT
jgi:hypothetical protein